MDFAYTQDYRLIKLGENKLTAKIPCFDDEQLNPSPFPTGTATPAFSSPLYEWHTVTVTGVIGAPSTLLPLPVTGNTEVIMEEANEEGSGDRNGDDNNGGNCDSSYPGCLYFETSTRLGLW